MLRLLTGALIALAVAAVACSDPEEDVAEQEDTATGTASATGSDFLTTPTISPSGTFQTSAAATPANTQNPAQSPSTALLKDQSVGYSIHYPSAWQARQVSDSSGIPDFVSAAEFVDEVGTVRGSVYVFANPETLSLRDWIADHDSIFTEGTIEEREIGGLAALVAPIGFDGRASPLAYFEFNGHVLGLRGLSSEDFDALSSGFRPTAS